VLVPLTDCAKGVGIGLNKANVITQLNPGGAAARSGLLRLGDHVVAVDGTTLEGRALRDVLRPADAHAFEVVRGNGAATRGAPPVASKSIDLDFVDPNLSPSSRPTPPPSPPSASAPPPTSASPPPSRAAKPPPTPEDLRQQGRQQALQRAHDRAAALEPSVGGASSGPPVPLEMQPTYPGDPLEMEPTYDDVGTLPVPLKMSRGGVEPNPQQRPMDPAAAARFGGASGRDVGAGLGGGLGGKLGGGFGGGHMKAALRRQMEADQLAAGGDQSDRLAEAVEAAQAQESLTANRRFRRMSSPLTLALTLPLPLALALVLALP